MSVKILDLVSRQQTQPALDTVADDPQSLNQAYP
jgi:hypothetical protein